MFMSSAFGQILLDDCQTKARQNFPLIKQYELIELSKEYTVSNANKSYLPQLDVTLIAGVVSGFPTFGAPGSTPSSSAEFHLISVLQLNQVIWDGGITKARKGVIESSAEMQVAELEVSLFALEQRVNNLFFGILLIDEQMHQIEILISTLLRNRKRVEIAVENGTAFKSDIDEIQVEIINAEQKMVELSANRDAYISILSAMIGEPIEKDVSFERPEAEEAFLALENIRPELSLFQNQENLINAQSAIDKSMLYPKIGLLAFGTFIQPGIEFGASQLDNIFVGGLSVNWSLGALYKNGNNKKLSELNLQKVGVQKETFLFNNNLELTQTRLEMKKYQTLLEQDKEILALKIRIREAYDTKYENGISTMSELLDRTNDESIARQNLIVHEIRYLMKAYQYKNKTGN
jgi:outer membrane protein TolC